MVPVNDDVSVPSNEDTVEAPGATPPTQDSAAQEPRDLPVEDSGSRRSRSGLDLWLGRAIWGVLGLLAIVGGFFGYSAYQAQQQARLASPALQLVDQVQKMVDKNPGDETLRARLGEALAAAGNLNEAKAQLIAAVKINPKYAGAYQDLAQIAIIEKDNPNIVLYLNKLLDVTAVGQYQNFNERREFAFFNLGELALAQKRWTDAIGYFNAALKIRKDASDTYLRLAQAYQGSGDLVAAMEQANISLQFDPKFPEAHYVRGTIYLANKDTVNAAWDFRAALDGAPDNQQALDALSKLGKFDDWMARAQSAFTDGDLKVAVDAVSIARSINPKSYAAAMLHGRILDQQGYYADAVDAYTIALKITPGDKAAAAALKNSQSLAKKGSK